MLDPIIAGDNEIDHIHKMIEVLGSPPSNWIAGNIQLKKLGLYFRPRDKPDLRHILNNASTLAVNLLERMLEYVPEKRITAKEILQHPYFQQFKETTPNKSPVLERGKSLDAHSMLRIRNSYMKSSFPEPNKLTMNNISYSSRHSKLLNTDIGTKFAKNKNELQKSFNVNIKPWTPNSVTLKSVPLHLQRNPLKISVTPILKHNSELGPLQQQKSWRNELTNSHNSYLQASNFQSYIN